MCVLHGQVREVHPVAGDTFDAMFQLDRDARMPAFIDAPSDSGAAFRALKIGVLCTGSVGMNIVSHLARLAPASLVIADRARMKPTGVLTHPIHPRHLGRKKADVAGELAKAVSPTTRVFVFDRDFVDLPTHVLAGLDYFFLSSDNISAEVSLSQRALRLGIPTIQASVYGRSLSAVARIVYGGDRGHGPGLCCGLLASEWEALDRAETFSCAPDDRASGEGSLPTTVPTASVSHLCGMAADLALMEFFRRVAGLGKAAGNRVIEYCGFTHQIAITKLARRRDCPLDHARDRLEICAGELSERTPRELLQSAGYGEEDRASVSIEGRSFVGLGWCLCDSHPVVGRFLETGATVGRCSRCGAECSAHPMYSYSDVPVNMLSKMLDQPLASLGAEGATAVRVSGERGARQFVAEFPDAKGAR